MRLAKCQVEVQVIAAVRAHKAGDYQGFKNFLVKSLSGSKCTVL